MKGIRKLFGAALAAILAMVVLVLPPNAAGEAPANIAPQVTQMEPRTRFSAADAAVAALSKIQLSRDPLWVVRAAELEQVATPEEVTARLSNLFADEGLHAKILQGMAVADLNPPSGAVILRIRPAIDAEEADHFVALKRLSDGQVTVSGKGGKDVTVPMKSLEALSSGEAIVVSDDPAALAKVLTLADRVRVGYWWAGIAAVGLVAVGLCHGSKARQFTPRRALVQAGVLTAGAMGLAGAMWIGGPAVAVSDAEHLGGDSYLIDFRDAQTPVTRADVKVVTAAEVRLALADPQLLWIDSRFQDEYDARHISGAICIPTFDLSTIRLRLAGIEMDRPIIVYCQDETCGRARSAAAALIRAGFTNVAYYPQGWRELSGWSAIRTTSAAELQQQPVLE